jgi:MinD-like ATPase involved in chromosome partitioning or flagellar assembly
MSAAGSRGSSGIGETQFLDDPAHKNSNGKKSKEDTPPQAHKSAGPNKLVPIPTMGPRAVWYGIGKKFGASPKASYTLSEKELAAIAAKQQEAELAGLMRRVRLVVRIIHLVVAFGNGKGGASKSTLAQLFAAAVKMAAPGRSVILIPTTTNQDTSTAFLNAGIDPEKSLTTIEAASGDVDLTKFRDLSCMIEETDHGVLVLSPPPPTAVDVEKEFNRDEFLAVFYPAYDNADAVVLDLGNDTANEQSVVMAGMELANVAVWVATADNPSTLELLSSSIARYMSVKPREGQIREPDAGQKRTPEQIPLSERAKNSVAIFSKTQPGETAEDYTRYLKRRDHQGNVIGELGFVGEVLLVPEDYYIAHNVKTDLGQLDMATLLAVYRYVNAIYDKAAELMNIDLPELVIEEVTGLEYVEVPSK